MYVDDGMRFAIRCYGVKNELSRWRNVRSGLCRKHSRDYLASALTEDYVANNFTIAKHRNSRQEITLADESR